MTAQRHSGSLQSRLGIRLALGVTAMWLVAAASSGLVVRHELGEAFDSALHEAAQRLLPLAVADVKAHDTGDSGRRIAPLGRHEEFLTYIVRDRTGRVLLASHDAELSAFPARPATGFHTAGGYRMFGETAVGGSVIIEVAEPLAHRREAATEASMALVLPLAFLVPVSLVGVWWFVRRGMRPVIGLRDEIETRGGGDLSPVAAAELPAEIGPIADAVNRLLDRLRRALESERSFTANSAHELRTPIASTLAQTQRLVAEAPAGPLRERAQRIEESLHQLALLSEKLMQLAKAEGGGLLSAEPHDPSVVLSHVAAEFRRGSDEDRLQLALPPDGTVATHIDADAFAILMRNLIENGLKHGVADEPVAISMAADGTVRVVNGGPVVAADALARLRGRFERGGTPASGAGLGLAIADAIAAGAGAQLDLASPATGRNDGFEAVLHLPA